MPSRILLVDDNDAFREATAKFLTEAGFEVVDAPGHQLALDILDDGKPLALLLVDIVVPQVNGFALARMARMKRLRLPVIYMTGADVPTKEANGPVLHKPFEPAALLAEIRKSLS